MGYQILHPEWRRGALRGVLFDMDGLVLDTEKLYTRFWQEALRFYGYPMTLEQALAMRGRGGSSGERQLRSFFGPEIDGKAMRRKRIELMDDYVAENGVELKPGIRELLDCLDGAGIQTAITSSSPPERIRQYLGWHGLDIRFGRLCSGYEVHNSKPAPDIYLYGAAALNLPPESCLALEDAPAGIEAAWRAGCLPILIPDRDIPGEETRRHCFAVADSLTDVTGMLQEEFL